MSEFELGVLIFSVGGCFGVAFAYIVQAIVRKVQGTTVTYTADVVDLDGKLRGSVIGTYSQGVDVVSIHTHLASKLDFDERPVNFRRV